MINRNVFALAVLAIVGMTSIAPASAQSARCKPVDVAAADSNYQLVGIARPKVDAVQVGDIISVTVEMAPSTARKDSSIKEVQACGDTAIFFKAHAVEVNGKHGVEIPLPTTAKDIKIKSCSKAANTCWTGTFNGDFTKLVNLTPEVRDTAKPAAPAKTGMTGKYKDDSI